MNWVILNENREEIDWATTWCECREIMRRHTGCTACNVMSNEEVRL